ncbi:hypothetical protein HMPREF0322_02243 [Desulfitobacterium hafniense DP7]|uniref:Uncharacterized protein n=1 Tax=Desulfitobacterium hafniense DP7 TaxID=537010 RepID=G9XMQ5_DESHA|nr:hypothetical protein HMPREF0322_02243 [Desulfitobacterium hafniense DP7]
MILAITPERWQKYSSPNTEYWQSYIIQRAKICKQCLFLHYFLGAILNLNDITAKNYKSSIWKNSF